MSLSTYLKSKGYTYDQYGEKIGVTGTSVYRYTTGEREPRPRIMKKMIEESNGELTYDDILNVSTQKNPRKN